MEYFFLNNKTKNKCSSATGLCLLDFLQTDNTVCLKHYLKHHSLHDINSHFFKAVKICTTIGRAGSLVGKKPFRKQK